MGCLINLRNCKTLRLVAITLNKLFRVLFNHLSIKALKRFTLRSQYEEN